MINSRQRSSSDITDFYMWLNKDGKINWISNINASTYQKYRGTDLSYRQYFTIPKKTYTAYYSSLIESNDKVPRLYISYPVINMTGTNNDNDNSNVKRVFTGVVVASIRLESLGNFLKDQLYPQFNSTIGLLDKNGTILYAPRAQQYVGENIFGNKFQSLVSSILHAPESKNLLNDLSNSLQGNTGSKDILINGKMNTVAYQPVVVSGKNFLTLYVSVQHHLATDVDALIVQHQYFTMLMVTIIGGVAFIIIFLVFSWNKRLETIVNARTIELKKANDSLASAIEKLKVHDKMQEEFINIAAHELRTPIQPILGLTQVIRSDSKDAKQCELLDITIRNAKRLKQTY